MSDFLQWWNLIFTLPFLAALGYLMLMAVGSITAETAVDADTDMAPEVEVAHDVDVHSASTLMEALSFLGLGKVPVSIIAICFCFVWGFSGWAGNQLWRQVFPTFFVWPSLGLALLSAVLLTRSLSLGLAKILPSTETYGATNQRLVGKVAEVRYTVTETSGRAQLRDDSGTFLEVSCRVPLGEIDIPPGRKVLLLGFDAQQQAFVVCSEPWQT